MYSSLDLYVQEIKNIDKALEILDKKELEIKLTDVSITVSLEYYSLASDYLNMSVTSDGFSKTKHHDNNSIVSDALSDLVISLFSDNVATIMMVRQQLLTKKKLAIKNFKEQLEKDTKGIDGLCS